MAIDWHMESLISFTGIRRPTSPGHSPLQVIFGHVNYSFYSLVGSNEVWCTTCTDKWLDPRNPKAKWPLTVVTLWKMMTFVTTENIAPTLAVKFGAAIKSDVGQNSCNVFRSDLHGRLAGPTICLQSRRAFNCADVCREWKPKLFHPGSTNK